MVGKNPQVFFLLAKDLFQPNAQELSDDVSFDFTISPERYKKNNINAVKIWEHITCLWKVPYRIHRFHLHISLTIPILQTGNVSEYFSYATC